MPVLLAFHRHESLLNWVVHSRAVEFIERRYQARFELMTLDSGMIILVSLGTNLWQIGWSTLYVAVESIGNWYQARHPPPIMAGWYWYCWHSLGTYSYLWLIMLSTILYSCGTKVNARQGLNSWLLWLWQGIRVLLTFPMRELPTLMFGTQQSIIGLLAYLSRDHIPQPVPLQIDLTPVLSYQWTQIGLLRN